MTEVTKNVTFKT